MLQMGDDILESQWPILSLCRHDALTFEKVCRSWEAAAAAPGTPVYGDMGFVCRCHTM
jgi:hypothetical protein